VLLPPTRSLARARRALAELPGGGATPLASGVREAHQLASAVVRSGQECHVVLLTDGRANVDSEGRGGRAAAHAEALVAARCLRADGIASIVIDISPKPGHESLELAEALGATYVPLPHGGAESISDTVKRFGRGGRMDSRRRSM
jgi:magnesium chelatase subunit D